MFQPRTPIRLVIAVLVTLSAAPILAQPSGRITGTVRDTGGAPLAGAAVTITNQLTLATRVVRSAAGGVYEAADLPPGSYTVSADVQGFRKITQRDRRLAAGAVVTVDFALELRVSADVTVSAMKRDETVSKTPFSVAAPTEESLREHGVETIEEVAANVPGFSVQNLGPGQNQVSMRGISSGQIARDQPGVKESVGAYLDESVISLSLFTPDLDLFDMNRVEVLRGPQGTLFGAGSEGGTVRYISNQPELSVSKFFGEVSGNSISGGGQGGTAKAGFNAPLGSMSALRVSAYFDRFAGYMDAVQPDLSIKNNVNSGDRTGFRAALTLAPSEYLTIVPRIAYQDVKMDGWNRIDIFNILGNPYTTTRPKVTLGERQLFTQIDEPYTDRFLLGDVNVKYNFGDVALTSITSYSRRNILVVRDATALTASITGGSIGLPEKIYTLNAPLDDKTAARSWTEELHLSGNTDRFKWVGGFFFADARRAYDQNLFVDGFDAASGIPTKGVFAPKDDLFFSHLNYKLQQYAFFGEATFAATDRFSVTGGLRYYHYKEDKEQVFDGLFGSDDQGRPQSQPGTAKANGVAPRIIASYKVSDSTTLNAQASKGFRLGGINDPLNVNLCTAQDLITFSGRESWKDEVTWNYEIGSKSRILGGRGTFNVAAYYDDIKDLQVTVTAGSCSSRLVFNVPKARSVGGEVELAAALSEAFDFSISGGYHDSKLRSTVTSTALDGSVSVVSGIQSGERLPSVPKFEAALSATFSQPITTGYIGYASGTYQHVGSRFTQVGDDLLGKLDLNSFGANTIGGPLTGASSCTIDGKVVAQCFTYNPELPAYDLVNVRFGVRHGNWDVAFYCNNLTDERAFLALDRERGTRARIGYLTNQPRTFGLTTRVDF